MLTVKCPHCQAGMKLPQAPASGKVKCPRCKNVVPVGAAGRVPSGGGQTVDPDDDAFDFGRVNFPSASPAAAVTHFPSQGNVSVYDGPIPGDPLAAENAEEGDTDEVYEPMPAAGGSKKTKKLSPPMVAGILGGVGVLVIGAVIVGSQMGGSDGAKEKVDLLAAAQATAPSGYKAVGIFGVVVLMPGGAEYDSMPSAIDSAGVLSGKTGSVYFMGAMNGGKREIDADQMAKKTERLLGGDILGAAETSRNGYKGIKGVLATSLFLPRMEVEMYHVEERFVVIGCAAGSMGAAPGEKVDRVAEGAEQKIFFSSFKIGPKPSGWFW